MAAPTQSLPTRSLSKPTVWTLLGLAALFVLLFVEVPTFRPSPTYASYHAQMVRDRFLLIPHAICGTLALLSGPIQFSTRLRRRNLQLHRYLGRVYVFSVFLAAPIAILISWGHPLIVGTVVQAGIWFLCTLAALLTARNRHLVQHRQWMIRSYAMTFTFITLRIPNVWPAYFNMSDDHFVITIITVTLLSVFLPDIAFNWRELTTKRS